MRLLISGRDRWLAGYFRPQDVENTLGNIPVAQHNFDLSQMRNTVSGCYGRCKECVQTSPIFPNVIIFLCQDDAPSSKELEVFFFRINKIPAATYRYTNKCGTFRVYLNYLKSFKA